MFLCFCFFSRLKRCCQFSLLMKTDPLSWSPFSSQMLHIIRRHLEVFWKKEGVTDTLEIYSSTTAKESPSILHWNVLNLWKPNICCDMLKWQRCSCLGGTVLIWMFSPCDCSLFLPLLLSMVTTDLCHSNILSLGTSIIFLLLAAVYQAYLGHNKCFQ